VASEGPRTCKDNGLIEPAGRSSAETVAGSIGVTGPPWKINCSRANEPAAIFPFRRLAAFST